MRSATAALLFCLAAAIYVFTDISNPDVSFVTGTWEGDSKCTVPDSPCHDEHVIYSIKKGSSPGRVTIDMDKVVNGERQSMGTLPCIYDPNRKQLRCVNESRKPAEWIFIVAGDRMTGTATLRQGNQLYRRITAQKRSDKAQ